MSKKEIIKGKNRWLNAIETENIMTNERAGDSPEIEEGFHDLIQNAVIGVYRTNEDGDFIFANKRLAQMFGFKTEQDFLGSHPNAARLYVNPEERETIYSNNGVTAYGWGR